MDFTGRYEIPAKPDTVWAGLNDPDTLKACIPGCEEITKLSPNDFQATATLKIGPVKARFRGKVTLSELDPPRRCVLSGEGQGGMAGFAKGKATVVLELTAAGTVLTYTARATVGGKLAQVGQRLIDGAAKQIADDFFGRFATRLSAPSTDTAVATAAAVTAEALSTTAVQPQPGGTIDLVREGLSAEIWVVGLIAVVAILLLLFSVSL